MNNKYEISPIEIAEILYQIYRDIEILPPSNHFEIINFIKGYIADRIESDLTLVIKYENDFSVVRQGFRAFISQRVIK